MVFYCDQASGFASDLGYQDERYLNALVRMFEQAITIVTTLPASHRDAFVARLERVRTISHECGYGVGDAMDSILAKYARPLGGPSMRRLILIPAPITAFTQPWRKLTPHRPSPSSGQFAD